MAAGGGGVSMARRGGGPATKMFLDYVNGSPSPFHCVDKTIARLTSAGFERLSEREAWTDLKKGGKYFCTRNQSALVAFVVGEEFAAGDGFCVAAAHTDSPCLRIKPVSKSVSEGLELVGCEWYGGGIWHTWFDRDLSVAGRVLVEKDGKVEPRLVNVERPILRVPSLAIHLDREVNEKMKVDKEAHLWALLAHEVKSTLGAASEDAKAEGEHAGEALADKRHSPVLLSVLAEAAAAEGETLSVSDIVDFEVCLYDTQPATVGGARDEFVFSPRLDNQMSCFCGTEALIAAAGAASASKSTQILGLFDHEEVGSSSVPGAASTFLEDVMRRVTAATAGDVSAATATEQWSLAMRKSLLISADMAHAAHPNYGHKHDRNHRPKLNGGVVIKSNTNQRYATTIVTASAVRKAAESAGVPVQEFVIKQDLGCGSTIGPILSTRLGMRTVDVGIAQLSMHSVREMCGAHDVEPCIKLIDQLYSQWPALDELLAKTD